MCGSVNRWPKQSVLYYFSPPHLDRKKIRCLPRWRRQPSLRSSSAPPRPFSSAHGHPVGNSGSRIQRRRRPSHSLGRVSSGGASRPVPRGRCFPVQMRASLAVTEPRRCRGPAHMATAVTPSPGMVADPWRRPPHVGSRATAATTATPMASTSPEDVRAVSRSSRRRRWHLPPPADGD